MHGILWTAIAKAMRKQVEQCSTDELPRMKETCVALAYTLSKLHPTLDVDKFLAACGVE